MELIANDLLGTWAVDNKSGLSISYDENGRSKQFQRSVLAGEIATYELQGDVLVHTLGDCDQMVDGEVRFFTCTAEYHLTYYKEEDNQAYLSFELIGEDELTFRRMMLTVDALWLQVDEE